MGNLKDNIKFANAGILYFFKTEKNARIQVGVAGCILLAAWFFNISSFEWCIILLCIALILSLEMINTALERVCAVISLEYHPMVKIIKDVAAGAVWLSSIIAITIGFILFVPYIINWLKL
ncbi:MAG: diacylglycerol kinase family protein [Chitinophagaceae bacterium]